MLITHLELENIKSYRHFSVDFRRGTTAIGGANGAGKTTLVEAIGFALFDYLPYNQGQFVREGEKIGKVVVHFIGNDDRPYEVERRVGSGGKWIIYDREADARIEQRIDVLDKLHELFGIDRERPLESLFRDALGVPQGSFTAIFLEPPSKRQQTFNALLQIEDYKIAADYLLEAQKEYREAIQTQENEIQRLNYETRELEDCRALLKEARLSDAQQKEQNVQWRQELAHYEERESLLTEQFEQLRQSQQRYEQSKTTHEAAQSRLYDRQESLRNARTARQAVISSSDDYSRYLQADETLKKLRQEEQQRNRLNKQRSSLQSILATISANIANLHDRLEEVAAARQQVVELSPLVEQQYELEKAREELARQVTQFEGLVKESRRLEQQRKNCLQQQEELQQRIAKVEPLQPLADKLIERATKLSQLQTRILDRGSKRKQFEEKRQQLQDKIKDREQTATNLQKVEDYIAKVEEHRQEAEELPELQKQYEHFSAQQHRLEGNIEGYKKSRKLSAGGQCPLLHQPCLNIKQLGLVSLESYFDGLLSEEHTQLAALSQQLTTISERSAYLKKYADALEKLGQQFERRDNYVERLQRLNLDITRLEREIADLEQNLEELKLVERLIPKVKAERDESEKADQQVRELEGFRKQVQQLAAQAQQYEADMRERRQQADELRGSYDALKQVEQKLKALNDPRARSKAQQEIVKREPGYAQQLQGEQQKQQEIAQQLQQLDAQFLAYADLDARISGQEAIHEQSLNGYQTYLKNEQEARLLPEREAAFEKARCIAEQAQQTLEVAEQAYSRAKADFHEQELSEVREKVKQLRGELERLAEFMRNLQDKINGLEQKITQAEVLLIELEAAQQEKRTLEELQTMMEQFRKLIKEAGPHVLKAMLADISAEANRIFGEIMGDRSAQLSWQNDYEIALRRQGIDRTFAQLSGGEQMSAALSVRLALLKKLSTLNIAFFDEPTQNMDELRRMNLAEQIRRVRGFDQLIVISHDDTFEQGLDSLIRLRKMDGETWLLTEDELDMVAEEQERVHAT